MNKLSLLKYSTQTLSFAARDLLAEVGINRSKLAGQKVYVTQFCELGISFLFSNDKEPAKEFHAPARIVPELFL